ncbi:MAG: diguanylate cyclase [Candidatus Omnitrophota bacterium]|jgi:diguanylate cyclase (GGDEF)-like protein/PAS domain S-box-containing protein
MRNCRSNDTRLFIGCASLVVLFFSLDIVFHWTAVGVLYLFVVMLSLTTTRDRDVYFFAILTSFLLIASWRLSPSTAKIWHVSIALIGVTAILGLRFKKARIIKSALAAIVDSSVDAIIGKTLTNVVLSWNKAAEGLLGYTSEEMVGQSARCLIHPERVSDEMRLLDEVKEGKVIKHYQTMRRHKDGHFIPVSLALSAVKDPFGNIVGISSIVRDISDRITAEKKLKELNDSVALERNKISRVLNIEEHLNTIFDINKLIDFVVEKTTEVLRARKCSLMLVDYDTRQLCIKGHKGIDHSFIQEIDLQAKGSIAGIIAHEGKAVLVKDLETDARFLREKRPSYETKSFMSAPIKVSRNILGFINVADKDSKEGTVFSELDLKILCMIVRQVAVALENAKLYRELSHLAITDPLTNIYNFRYFTKSLDHELVRLKRHPTRPLCLLMIDVDDFKSYNDIFGHLEGDTLLKIMSKVFQENIREIDIVCRYAGDEFVVILPETDVSEAMFVAGRIKGAVETLTLKRKVTVSIGISKCSTYDTNRYELIQRADIALSNAKKEGKNLVHCVG